MYSKLEVAHMCICRTYGSSLAYLCVGVEGLLSGTADESRHDGSGGQEGAGQAVGVGGGGDAHNEVLGIGDTVHVDKAEVAWHGPTCSWALPSGKSTWKSAGFRS